MQTAAIIIVAVLGGLTLLYLILKFVFAAVRRKLAQRIIHTFTPGEMIRATVNANYFGLESLRGKQIRGNCALVLTKDILWSSLAAPRRDLPIPLNRIRKVSLVRSHCGRAILRDLLRVDFHAADTDNAIAWYVPDAQAWKAALETAIQKQS